MNIKQMERKMEKLQEEIYALEDNITGYEFEIDYADPTEAFSEYDFQEYLNNDNPPVVLLGREYPLGDALVNVDPERFADMYKEEIDEYDIDQMESVQEARAALHEANFKIDRLKKELSELEESYNVAMDAQMKSAAKDILVGKKELKEYVKDRVIKELYKMGVTV